MCLNKQLFYYEYMFHNNFTIQTFRTSQILTYICFKGVAINIFWLNKMFRTEEMDVEHIVQEYFISNVMCPTNIYSKKIVDHSHIDLFQPLIFFIWKSMRKDLFMYSIDSNTFHNLLFHILVCKSKNIMRFLK